MSKRERRPIEDLEPAELYNGDGNVMDNVKINYIGHLRIEDDAENFPPSNPEFDTIFLN